MITYKKKTNKITYDINKIEQAHEYVLAIRDGKGVTREQALEMKRLLQEILDTLKFEDIVIDSDRKETEKEAREYFGDEFIRKFEEIKKACVEGETTLVIHGTDVESAEQIQNEGLFAKSNDLSSTAIGYTYLDEYSTLLNWPHKYLKGLVMIGVPRECSLASKDGQVKGIFEYVEDDSKSEYSLEYRIRPEFIIGYIDVENKQIYENESYSNKHDYTGLIVDRRFDFEDIGVSDTKYDWRICSKTYYNRR